MPARGGDTQGRGEQKRSGGGEYLAGLRAGLPFGLATAMLGVSFGVLARSLDWEIVAPIVFSVITFSGSAQFAAAAVLGAGGGVVPAVVAAWLLIARFLPMGIAVVAPYLKGGPLRRALEGQAIVDASCVALAAATTALTRAFV